LKNNEEDTRPPSLRSGASGQAIIKIRDTKEEENRRGVPAGSPEDDEIDDESAAVKTMAGEDDDEVKEIEVIKPKKAKKSDTDKKQKKEYTYGSFDEDEKF
jgi:hypothetical protein